MTGILTASAGVNYPKTLLGIIHNLGLTTNLNFVLDAADLRSYDGSSQTWTDATGQGNSFFLGADGAATATDPTFVGTAGLATDGTYFSFDGGDYFTETAAHTFADDWHKNNGLFSLVAVIYMTNSANSRAIFSNTAVNGIDGIDFRVGASEQVHLEHPDTATTNEDIITTAVTTASWNFVGASFSEAALSVDFQVNGTVTNSAVTATTNADANVAGLRIGAGGNARTPFDPTERLACIAGWSTNIGAAALNNIYTRLKSRRFTTLP